MEDYSYLFKIILIGDANVGKTCLVKRFTKGFFAPSQGPTIGVDFTIRTVEVDGEKVKVSLYLVVTSSFVILLKRKFGKGRACGLPCMGSKAARAKLLFRFFFVISSALLYILRYLNILLYEIIFRRHAFFPANWYIHEPNTSKNYAGIICKFFLFCFEFSKPHYKFSGYNHFWKCQSAQNVRLWCYCHIFFPLDDLLRFIIFLRLMDFNLSRAKYIFAGTCLALVDIITNLRHLLYLAHFRAAADFP